MLSVNVSACASNEGMIGEIAILAKSAVFRDISRDTAGLAPADPMFGTW